MGTFNGYRQLSYVEAAIIAALAGGASDMEAAARLHLYDDTVRRYLRSAMRRWAATDRQHLLSLWRATRQEAPTDNTTGPTR